MPTFSHSPFMALRQIVRIVLVEPAGGLNVGSIARVAKNMGIYHLTLVNPKCDPFGEDALQMAVHAIDVLQTAQVVQTLPEALKGCQRAIATTARDRDLTLPVESPKAGLTWLLHGESLASSSSKLAILFGPEDRGLSNAELIYAQRLIKIPTNPDYASLNLAQAVAICCYELSQVVQSGAEEVEETGVGGEIPQTSNLKITSTESLHEPFLQCDSNTPNAYSDAMLTPQHSNTPTLQTSTTLDQLEGYYQQLEEVLLRIGYLYPHTAKRRMEKFRVLFNRSGVTHNEMAMLRGMLRQINWALEQATQQTDDDQDRD